MNLDFAPNIIRLDNKFAAVISGLVLGFPKRNLEYLNELAMAEDKSYKLPVIITTWNLKWNSAWVDGLISEIEKYDNLIPYVFYESYTSERFINFIKQFCKEFKIEKPYPFTSNLFKPLAVFYINHRAFNNCYLVANKISPESIWSTLKFNSNVILPAPLPTIDSYKKSIHRLAANNTNYFTKKNRYYMNGPLDCISTPYLGSDGIKEHLYFCGIDSIRRVFKPDSNTLAKELANFFKLNSYTESYDGFSTALLLEELFTPCDFRSEGFFIFKHLIDNAIPKVNYCSDTELLMGCNAHNVRSPDMEFDVDGNFHCMDNQNVVEQLNTSKKYIKLDYILDESMYSNLNYSSTEEIVQ